jgi:hypothetical protein
LRCLNRLVAEFFELFENKFFLITRYVVFPAGFLGDVVAEILGAFGLTVYEKELAGPC